MTRSRIRGAAITVITVAVLCPIAAQDDRAEQVYQIFRKQCFGCHGQDAQGGLDLRSHATLTKGGTNGRVIVPHDAARSRLYRLISRDGGHPTGKSRKLAVDELEAIRQCCS